MHFISQKTKLRMFWDTFETSMQTLWRVVADLMLFFFNLSLQLHEKNGKVFLWFFGDKMVKNRETLRGRLS